MKLSSLSSRRRCNLSPSTSTCASYIISGLLLHDLDSDGVLELVSLSLEGVLSVFRLDQAALEMSSVLKPLLPLCSCFNLGTLMDVAIDEQHPGRFVTVSSEGHCHIFEMLAGKEADGIELEPVRTIRVPVNTNRVAANGDSLVLSSSTSCLFHVDLNSSEPSIRLIVGSLDWPIQQIALQSHPEPLLAVGLGNGVLGISDIDSCNDTIWSIVSDESVSASEPLYSMFVAWLDHGSKLVVCSSSGHLQVLSVTKGAVGRLLWSHSLSTPVIGLETLRFRVGDQQQSAVVCSAAGELFVVGEHEVVHRFSLNQRVHTFASVHDYRHGCGSDARRIIAFATFDGRIIVCFDWMMSSASPSNLIVHLERQGMRGTIINRMRSAGLLPAPDASQEDQVSRPQLAAAIAQLLRQRRC